MEQVETFNEYLKSFIIKNNLKNEESFDKLLKKEKNNNFLKRSNQKNKFK